MKLFRFIYNVWNSVWDAIFDRDMKYIAKMVIGYAIVAAALLAVFYGLGLFGQWMGLAAYLPKGKENDTVGLGTMVFCVLFIGLMFLLALWGFGYKLIEIWRKS